MTAQLTALKPFGQCWAVFSNPVKDRFATRAVMTKDSIDFFVINIAIINIFFLLE